MARLKSLLIAFLVGGVAGSTFAQAPAAGPTPQKRRASARAAADSPELENVRKAIEALTPEQRQRFKENFIRWSNLSPEEKKSLRAGDEVRRRRMSEEIGRAVEETGLTLDTTQREAFARRYGQERRKVEEQLRRETEEKRKPLLQDIIARLKEEFASASPVAPATQGAN